MTRIKPRLLLKSAILGALVCPATLYALGLGEIHLNSALSQPFDAEVELVNPTADEISTLKVGLASSESFTRFGIDRPSYLSNLDFKVTPTGNGRAVVHITSTKSITEPVVSLLLEVSSASGRQLREYTVFLDPPVFVPSQPVVREEPRSVTPPPVEPSRNEGVIERAPQPEPTAPANPPAVAVVPPPVTTAPAEPVAEAQPAQPLPTPETPRSTPEPSATATPSFTGESYEVKRNESLWKIAARIRPGAPQEINQTMIALYRANPSAFIGNINRLRSGAVLRVPAAEEMQAIDPRAATAEVSRQYSEWRPAEASAASAEDRGHLKLVTPTEPVEAPVTAAAEKAKADKAAADKAAAEKAAAEKAKAAEADRAAKQREADAEAKRLLELKNAEMARLQRERDERAAAEKAAAAKAAADKAAAEKAAADKAAAEKAAAEKTVQPTAEEPPPAETPAEQPAAEVKKPAPTPVAPPPEPSFLDTLKDNLMTILGGLLVVGLVIVWVVYSRRRQSSLSSGMQFPMPTSSEPTMTPSEFEAALDETPPARTRARQETYESDDLPDSLPEAEGTKPLYGGAPPEEAPTKPARAADDTMSSETAIHVDQQDAVAEADFHMAYGLYDQAADLVKIAIGRDPKRRDLKLKLLEIYFVWGNKEQFIETARELHETRAQAGAGEWDKILIMGKQIAPEDPLFKGSATGSAGDMLDVNLEGGENRVDFDLFSTPDGAGAEPSASLDFEIGNTGARAKPQSHLDFLLDDVGNAPLADDDTREMDANARTQETPTIESPALSGFDESGREPTVEMNFGDQPAEQTAELSIDDLGLDVGSLESTGSLERTTALSGARREHLGDEIGDDELTRIAPLSELPPKGRAASLEPTMEVPAFKPDSTQRGKANGHAADDDGDGDGDVGVSTIYLEQMEAPNGDVVETLGPRGDETAHMLSPSDLDLDLAQLGETDASDEDTIRGKAARITGMDATAEMPAPRGRIPDTAATVEQPRPNLGRQDTIVATSDLPEIEPVTMSEVGTKLDLARAYMDMGDPDGARSILEEVLGEGNSGQRAEAQRLLDSIR